jgi:hypothetical protein
MKSFLFRIETDKQLLDERIKEIQDFWESPDFFSVSYKMRRILEDQMHYMKKYSQTLTERQELMRGYNGYFR